MRYLPLFRVKKINTEVDKSNNSKIRIMELKTKPKAVAKSTTSDFLCVNDYLMAETENIKEEEKLGTVVEYDEHMRDYYTRDYYWITTSGEIVKKMSGSGIKQEDLDLYERVKDGSDNRNHDKIVSAKPSHASCLAT